MPDAIGVDCYHFQRLPSDPSASPGGHRWIVGATYRVGTGRNRFSDVVHDYRPGRRLSNGEVKGAVAGATEVLRALDQFETRRRGRLRYGYEELLQVLRQTTAALQTQCTVLRELIFEEVRTQEFPSRPSRERCLWLAPSWQAVQFWQRWGPCRKQWFKVRLLAGRFHLADAALLTTEDQTIAEVRDQARAYWTGDIAPDHVRAELLFEGDLQVLAALDPGDLVNGPPS
jgi:hypothetical protein